MEIYFSSDYDNQNLFMMQVPDKLLNRIEKKEELIIKGTKPAVLCSNSETYSLNEAETTNTLLLLIDNSSDKKEIIMKQNFFVEAKEKDTEKNSIYNIIKDNSSLKYDMITLENNINSFKKKLSFKDLFSLSELSAEKFQEYLKEKNIFEYNQKIMVKFDFDFLSNIIIKLLKQLVEINEFYFNSNDMIFKNLISNEPSFAKLYDILGKNEKESILNEICDISFNKNLEKEIVLNFEKISIFFAKKILFEENDEKMDLELFINSFNKFLYLYIPTKLLKDENEKHNTYLSFNDCQDNLYPFLKKYDLRCLKGFCTIYKDNLENKPFIKWIEPPKIDDNFDSRLSFLFKINKFWRIEEIIVFMKDMGISDKYLNEKISRRTRPFEVTSLLNKEKKISVVYLK